jgi:hypothetical protein
MTTVGLGRPGARRPSHLPITLADLITAVQDVVGPADDGLVVVTAWHLLQSGRLSARRTSTRRCPPQRQETEVVAHWRSQTPGRGGTPVALRPESRWERIAASHRKHSHSITGKEVKSHGRALVVCCFGRVARGAWGISGSCQTPAKRTRGGAGPSLNPRVTRRSTRGQPASPLAAGTWHVGCPVDQPDAEIFREGGGH